MLRHISEYVEEMKEAYAENRLEEWINAKRANRFVWGMVCLLADEKRENGEAICDQMDSLASTPESFPYEPEQAKTLLSKQEQQHGAWSMG